MERGKGTLRNRWGHEVQTRSIHYKKDADKDHQEGKEMESKGKKGVKGEMGNYFWKNGSNMKKKNGSIKIGMAAWHINIRAIWRKE
jgi:hypothetical protein